MGPEPISQLYTRDSGRRERDERKKVETKRQHKEREKFLTDRRCPLPRERERE